MSVDSYWALDPSVVYLNHGSFGACPTPVLTEQARLRYLMEQNPMRFFCELPFFLENARIRLAEFLHAQPEDVAFVANATHGVNTILRSLHLKPGDELLTTNHAYNACRNALDFCAQQTGARVRIAEVPFPLNDSAEVIHSILKCVTPNTRLALIDHITSPTALIFPIRELVKELELRGVDTLVDGAHAPGMVALHLDALGAAYYTGNLHKWVCAPKGAAFLHVRRDKQTYVHPLAQSHGMTASLGEKSRFQLEFEWTGTDDFTPHLCVPVAIDFLSSLSPAGFDGLMAHNHELALQGRQLLCSRLKQPAPCPEDMVGSMAAVALPQTATRHPSAEALQAHLALSKEIEVPVIAWPNPAFRWVRISAQWYNSLSQFSILADALLEAVSDTD